MNTIAFFGSFLLFSLFIEGEAFIRSTPKKCPSLSIRKAKVRLRNRSRLAKVTCQAGYQLLGEKFVFCEEGRWADPLPSCIRGGCPSLKIMVLNAHFIESYSGALVEVTCDDGYTMTGNPILSCNGVSWNDTTPSCYLDKKNIQKTCDFESDDTCEWMNDFTDNFDWKIHSMATPSGNAGTGPEFDHSLGAGLNGKYLYIEASNRNAGDVARLISPRYPPVDGNSTNCFSFWYHMYGGHIGSLNVYVGQDLKFSESGNHGNRWIKAVIPINQTSYPFYITIDGVRGNGYAGDIAIDDLKLSEGSDCTEQKNDTEVVLTGSCLGRCYENTTEVVNSCYCHDDCHVNSSCCADFYEICGLGNQASYYKEDTRIITPSTIVGIILATLTLGVIVCTVVFLIRRKRINGNGNADDDSDVQFFTSDELINFNLARPSPDRQRSEPASKPQRPKKAVPQDCIRLVEQ